MNEKTKRIFLKPCPLCGSAPQEAQYQCEPWGRGDGYATCYYYICTGCQYLKSNSAMSTSCFENEPIKNKAKELWNEMVDEVNEMIKDKLVAE